MLHISVYSSILWLVVSKDRHTVEFIVARAIYVN